MNYFRNIALRSYIIAGIPVSFVETYKLYKLFDKNVLTDISSDKKHILYRTIISISLMGPFVIGTIIHPFLYSVYYSRGELYQINRTLSSFVSANLQSEKIHDS